MVAKGSHLSEEHKLKISLALKGRNNHQLGTKRSEESLEKMRNAQRGINNGFYGKKHSAETIEKIRLSKLNKPLSEEHKQKLREVNSGVNNPFYGKHHSLEAREKLRQSKMGNKFRKGKKGRHKTKEEKRFLSEFNKGKILSAETKLKMSLRLLAELNPRWKGGITPEILRIRHCHEYKEWRRNVFKRDYWTCQMCGKKKGVKIIAHHIKAFKDYHNIRFDINNGITLCKYCHENTGLHNKRLKV